MLALAYDCTLRREELCTITTGDIDPARRLLTIRAENTKIVVPELYHTLEVTSELYSAWLIQCRKLSTARGLLFLSRSQRN